MTDFLQDLQECSWRGISFPISNIDEVGSQDLAIHKRTDRDGAFVEATGRAPFTYSVTALFIPNLTRGTNETWDDLFPARFQQFRSAFLDRTSGTLIHPLYGNILCKPQNWNTSLNAEERGGVKVSATFLETTKDSESSSVLPTDFSSAKTTAQRLDTYLGELNPSPTVFFPNDPFQSFSKAIDSLSGTIDNVTMYKNKTQSLISSTINKLDSLIRQLDRTVSVIEVNPITQAQSDLGPLGNGISRIWLDSQTLLFNLLNIQQNILKKDKEILTLVLDRRETFITLMIRTKNSITELKELNPNLQRGPIIPENAIIQYYKKG